MRKRVVGWLVLLPLCAVVVFFALANRHPVVVGFNPLAPVDASVPGYGVPLFLVVYAVLFLGISIGGIAVWWSQGVHRREEKRYRKEAERLRAELEAVRRVPARERDPALAAADDLL